MRLSLLEHEEAQRKQAQEKKTADSAAAVSNPQNTNSSSATPSSANAAAAPSLLLPRAAASGSSPGARSQGLSSRVESRDAELNRSNVPLSTPSVTASSISQSSDSVFEPESVGSRTPPTTTRTTATSIAELPAREDPEGAPESCVIVPYSAGAASGDSSGQNTDSRSKDLKHGNSVSSPPSPASIATTPSSYAPLLSTPALEDEEPLLGERGSIERAPLD